MTGNRGSVGDHYGALDSTIIALGLGVLSWEVVISPYAHDSSLSFLARAASMAYALIDIGLLGVMARLVFGP